MTHEEKRLYLIKTLLAEQQRYRNIEIPAEEQGQKDLLRSLMNVRLPAPLSDEYIGIESDYLKEETAAKGITRLADLTPAEDGVYLWQGDITTLECDAIVNAANSQMLGCFVPMHTCIDNCIHTFAGVQLRAECARQMTKLRDKYGADYEQPTAVPMLTDAYNLPAKKIVHIVGPIVQGRLTPALEKDLSDCYTNTLDLCAENGLKSVAFCCISTGVFCFPNKRAAEIAVETVEKWLKEHKGAVDRVIFNVFKDEDKAYYEELLY